LKRLGYTIRNLIYPDPRGDGAYQAWEEIQLDRKCPWKRSDWIGLVILSLLIALVIGLTGCGKRMSGVYEMDMSGTMAQMGLPTVKGMLPEMGGMYRITFNGNRVVVQSGISEIRGNYKVKGDIIYVSAEGYGP
jgi:hypothetical protein